MPTYEEKNKGTLVDANDNKLDMHGNKVTERKPITNSNGVSNTNNFPNGAPKAADKDAKKDEKAKDGKTDDKAKDVKKDDKAAPAALVQAPKPVVAAVAAPVAAPVASGKIVLSAIEKNFENTLAEIFGNHEDSVSLMTADSSFHKLSHLSDPETNYRTLDKAMTE